MSFDLFLLCVRLPEVLALDQALQAAGLPACLAVAPATDLLVHRGHLPLTLLGAAFGPVSEGPEWSADVHDARAEAASFLAEFGANLSAPARAILERATVSVVLRHPEPNLLAGAATWMLAAAVITAGQGLVSDPQSGGLHEAPPVTELAHRLWREVQGSPRSPADDAALLASIPVDPDLLGRPTAQAELRAIAQLRLSGHLDPEIRQLLIRDRDDAHARRLKALRAELGPLIADPAALEQKLRRKRHLDPRELLVAVELAWQAQHPRAAQVIIGLLPGPAIESHVAGFLGAPGVATRLYLEFLAATGALARLDDDARARLLASCREEDQRQLLSPSRS